MEDRAGCQTHFPRLIGPTKEFASDYIVLLQNHSTVSSRLDAEGKVVQSVPKAWAQSVIPGQTPSREEEKNDQLQGKAPLTDQRVPTGLSASFAGSPKPF